VNLLLCSRNLLNTITVKMVDMVKFRVSNRLMMLCI